ncbi:MAG: hypothetical protein M3T55_08845 [Pseudomonadota bacterium]|nr:hypothetical protein [Pseudomonadota bacterium]
MAVNDPLIRALNFQAVACAAMGSPFSAAILEAASADAARGGPTRALFAHWKDASTRVLIADAASLRLWGPCTIWP